MSDPARTTHPAPLPQSSLDRCIASAVEAHEHTLRSMLPYVGTGREAIEAILDALEDAKIARAIQGVREG